MDNQAVMRHVHRMFTVNGARILQATLRLRYYFHDDELTWATLALCEHYHWRRRVALRRDVEVWNIRILAIHHLVQAERLRWALRCYPSMVAYLKGGLA